MAKKGRRSDLPRQSISVETGRISSRLASALADVDEQMRTGDWVDARDALTALSHYFPNQAEVWGRLVNACFELNDFIGYTLAARQLLKLTPRDPDPQYGLIASYLQTARLALGYRQAHRFVELFPNDDRVSDASQLAGKIHPILESSMNEMGLSLSGDLDFLCSHEEAQIFLDDGDYGQARRLNESLLRVHPNFMPVLNNLSLIEYTQGNLERAIGMAQRTLTVNPDNYHALSNLSRYQCLSGNLKAAQHAAEHLKTLSQQPKFHTLDFATKAAEAFSYLGDDEGVLAVAKLSETDAESLSDAAALLMHLTAVAALRLGDDVKAKALWVQTLRSQPEMMLAQENLDDLRNPAGQRNTPFAYNLTDWLSKSILADVRAEIGMAVQRGDDESMRRAARRIFRKHPVLETLVPLLLDRGDIAAREIGLILALAMRTPALEQALRDFTLSPRGTDQQRMRAGRAAREAGLLGAKVMLWVQGEQQELLLMAFQIHHEPSSYQHAEDVQDMAEEAICAVREGKCDKARALLQEALSHEPDAPDLQMNLSRIYEADGDLKKADEMMRDIHQCHPEYFFGRTGMARIHIRAGQLDEAKVLLNPMLEISRIHASEFAALAVAEGELFLAEDKLDGVRQWVNLLKDVDPDNPAVRYLESLISDKQSPGRLAKRLSGKKTK